MKNRNANKKNILIIGSAVIDVIIRIAKMPQPGDDIVGHKQGYNVGGCAYNVSKILDYLEMKHDLCVPVGQGMYADIIEKELVKANHEIFIKDDSEDNGYSLSLVEDSSERTFITIDGIETKWKNEWFKNIDVKKYDYIYVSGYGFQDTNKSGDVIMNFLRKKKADCHLILDPGPRLLGKHYKDELMKMNTILDLNEHEAKEMTGETEVIRAAEKLYILTKNPVIITLGGQGTLYYTIDDTLIVSGQKVEAIDTIGAGDSHTAALIAGLASGKNLRDACSLANAIAAKVVQKVGCNI